MKGSDKQIKWAKDIINGFEMQLRKEMADTADRVERNSLPPICADIVNDICLDFISKIHAFDDAAKIIRDRNFPIVRTVIDAAQARYTEWAESHPIELDAWENSINN